MGVIIKAENISKAYQLGQIGTGTLSRDIERLLAKIRGKEDPFLKIGELNDRNVKGKSNVAWSLRDINFEIQAGDAVGIIGKNGAGKSTLLKILSRITSPTTGRIQINGRMASLLEVGTGFHPELSGRENIYLNGAILGMRKYEIKRKFDEIVDFSGVTRYIDTPVKRYSSGMYVRLAFAVAAHLEPEILIVDEVLAVGDAEFQKKCLGKMKDVSENEGRTILFVSHNIAAVQSLCNKGILLNNGILLQKGEIKSTIAEYLSLAKESVTSRYWDDDVDTNGNENVKLKSVSIKGTGEESIFNVTTALKFEAIFINLVSGANLNISFHLKTTDGATVFNNHSKQIICNSGLHKAYFTIPGNFLNNGFYSIHLMIVKDGSSIFFEMHECLNFEIEDYREGGAWFGKWEGAIRPTFLNINLESI